LEEEGESPFDELRVTDGLKVTDAFYLEGNKRAKCHAELIEA